VTQIRVNCKTGRIANISPPLTIEYLQLSKLQMKGVQPLRSALSSLQIENVKNVQYIDSTVVSRLTYASPAWWGFVNAEGRKKLQSVLNRAVRWGFYRADSPVLEQLYSKRDDQLFSQILNNANHVLYQYLPPPKSHHYNLRARAHGRELPPKSSSLMDKNFLHRLLFKAIY